MRTLRKLGLALFVLTLAAGAREAALVVNGYGVNKTYQVQDQDVEVDGSNHRLTLTGSVRTLEVNGTNNDVTVEKAMRIEVNGVGNSVHYSGPKPDIEINGLNNSCEERH